MLAFDVFAALIVVVVYVAFILFVVGAINIATLISISHCTYICTCMRRFPFCHYLPHILSTTICMLIFIYIYLVCVCVCAGGCLRCMRGFQQNGSIQVQMTRAHALALPAQGKCASFSLRFLS